MSLVYYHPWYHLVKIFLIFSKEFSTVIWLEFFNTALQKNFISILFQFFFSMILSWVQILCILSWRYFKAFGTLRCICLAYIQVCPTNTYIYFTISNTRVYFFAAILFGAEAKDCVGRLRLQSKERLATNSFLANWAVNVVFKLQHRQHSFQWWWKKCQ